MWSHEMMSDVINMSRKGSSSRRMFLIDSLPRLISLSLSAISRRDKTLRCSVSRLEAG